MNKSQKLLIQRVANFIDKDKYNLILTSKDYDKYLGEILSGLCVTYISLESTDKTGRKE